MRIHYLGAIAIASVLAVGTVSCAGPAPDTGAEETVDPCAADPCAADPCAADPCAADPCAADPCAGT